MRIRDSTLHKKAYPKVNFPFPTCSDRDAPSQCVYHSSRVEIRERTLNAPIIEAGLSTNGPRMEDNENEAGKRALMVNKTSRTSSCMMIALVVDTFRLLRRL